MRQQSTGGNGTVLLPTACNARLLTAAAHTKSRPQMNWAAVTAVWEESEEVYSFFRKSSHPLILPGWEGRANRLLFASFPVSVPHSGFVDPSSQAMSSCPLDSRIHCYLSSHTGRRLFKGQTPPHWHRCHFHTVQITLSLYSQWRAH